MWRDTFTSSLSSFFRRFFVVFFVFSSTRRSHIIFSHTWTIKQAGADSCVRVWKLESAKDKPVFCVSLEAHSATVNCVRFSPSGEILASGSDDHRIFLWRRNEQRTSSGWTFDQIDCRNQITHRMLRGHKSDIYTLSWSPNGLFLASGSTDNTICLWNVAKNKRVNEFDNVHSHYVQGVAWDPRDRYVLSQSCDRTVSERAGVALDIPNVHTRIPIEHNTGTRVRKKQSAQEVVSFVR